MQNQIPTVKVQPRRVAQILSAVAFLVAVFSFISQYLTLFPDSVSLPNPMENYILNNYFILEFQVNTSSNIVIYFSAFILLAAAAALFLFISLYKNAVRDTFKRNWSSLAILFLYLSVDKASVLPEKYVKLYNAWTDANGWFEFRWAFILLALLILGFLFRKFLRHLEAPLRNPLLASIILYHVGMLGVELFSGHYTSSYNPQTLGLAVLVLIGELMEFGGLILLIYTLLHYIEIHLPDTHFLIRSNPKVNNSQEITRS